MTEPEVVPKNETLLTIGLRRVGPVMLYRTGVTHDQQAKSPVIHPCVQVSSGVGNRERRPDVGGNVITTLDSSVADSILEHAVPP